MPNPPAPAKRRRWPIWVGIGLAVFIALAIIGNLLPEEDEPDAAASPITTSEAPEPTTAPPAPATAPEPASDCYPASEISDPDLAAFTASLVLPPGVQVVTGRATPNSAHPGMVGVAIDLCAPDITTADELRPIATSIAAALRPTPLGERTFALWISDMGPEFADEAKLKDSDFQIHLWNGRPSAEAENARWEVVVG